MSNESDFQRPIGISQGILLNTNNEALRTYKKTKERFNKINNLESQIQDLNNKFDLLLKKLDDRNNHTN